MNGSDVKREKRRTPNYILQGTLCCFTIEEDRPALLQECEERLPVRNKGLKRPVVEEGALAQELNESFVKESRNSPALIMPAQKHPQEVRRLLDQFR